MTRPHAGADRPGRPIFWQQQPESAPLLGRRPALDAARGACALNEDSWFRGGAQRDRRQIWPRRRSPANPVESFASQSMRLAVRLFSSPSRAKPFSSSLRLPFWPAAASVPDFARRPTSPRAGRLHARGGWRRQTASAAGRRRRPVQAFIQGKDIPGPVGGRCFTPPSSIVLIDEALKGQSRSRTRPRPSLPSGERKNLYGANRAVCFPTPPPANASAAANSGFSGVHVRPGRGLNEVFGVTSALAQHLLCPPTSFGGVRRQG